MRGRREGGKEGRGGKTDGERGRQTCKGGADEVTGGGKKKGSMRAREGGNWVWGVAGEGVEGKKSTGEEGGRRGRRRGGGSGVGGGEKAGRKVDKKARTIACGMGAGFIAGVFLLYQLDSGAGADCSASLGCGIGLLPLACLMSLGWLDSG